MQWVVIVWESYSYWLYVIWEVKQNIHESAGQSNLELTAAQIWSMIY